MAANQLTLGYLLKVLGNSLHSVDLRAAVVRSGGAELPLFTGIRLSARSPEEVVGHYAELDGRMVGRETPRLRIIWEALPFENVHWVLNQLSLGILQIGGRELPLSKGIAAETLTGRVTRNHLDVRVWDDSPSAAYFSASSLESEKLSALWYDPDISMSVQSASGLESQDEMVDAFLEISGPNRLAINFFCYVEMPGWIEAVTLKGNSLEAEVLAAYRLRNVRFIATVSAPGQGSLSNRAVLLEEVARDSKYRRLRGEARLDQTATQGIASCVLTCDGLPVLDSLKLPLGPSGADRDSKPLPNEAEPMKPVSNPYKMVSEQLHSLRTVAEGIHVPVGPGPGNSGITALIQPFNSYLQQTRKLLAHDPAALETIAHIEPLKLIQERLDASYHRVAKQTIIVIVPFLLQALAPYVPRETAAARPETPFASKFEADLHTALEKLRPSTANSYFQALYDLADKNRPSVRGTAVELRETLRDVLDHLAPDNEVTKSPGFTFEDDKSRPTMKQKARFILKSRGLPHGARASTETAIERVEEATAALARSLYDRGSLSSHVAMTRTEAEQLKRYVDAILGDLLQIQQG
jgi:hypothetical protein